MSIETFLPAFAAVAAVTSGGLASFIFRKATTLANRQNEPTGWERELLEAPIEDTASIYLSWATNSPDAGDVDVHDVLDKLRTGMGVRHADAKDEARAHKMVEELRARLDVFEQRFPEADEIDKYASVNEALMQQKIDFLVKQVDELREELTEQRKGNLTTGKVYGIVFTVLAGVFAVVAAVPFVLDQLTK